MYWYRSQSFVDWWPVLACKILKYRLENWIDAFILSYLTIYFLLVLYTVLGVNFEVVLRENSFHRYWVYLPFFLYIISYYCADFRFRERLHFWIYLTCDFDFSLFGSLVTYLGHWQRIWVTGNVLRTWKC